MDNKSAKKIVSVLGKYGLIPVGSYGRDSHQKSYKDLDFLSFKSIDKVYEILEDEFPNGKKIKKGKLYLSYKLPKGSIDVWKTNNNDFYEDYFRRTIEKGKLIYLNKLLKLK